MGPACLLSPGAISAPPPPGETMVAPDSSSAASFLSPCTSLLVSTAQLAQEPLPALPPPPVSTMGRLGAGRQACTLGRPAVAGRRSPTPHGSGGALA